MTKQSGFTFFEILMVVAAMGMVLYAVTAIVLNTFRARTKANFTDMVEANGAYALEEIRKNLMNASAVSVKCVGKQTIQYRDSRDGDLTTLECGLAPYFNRIASRSGAALKGDILLTNSEAFVYDCTQFVTCTNSPTSASLVSRVDIKFSINAGVTNTSPESSSDRTFNETVFIRN